jgi:hypothetical protein
VEETFSLLIDGDIPINGYYKKNASGGWVNLATAVVTENGKTRLDFAITDGGEFDSNPAPGVIGDPGAPGYQAPLSQIHMGTNNGINVFNAMNIYGALGQETVRLQATGNRITVDQNIERIEIPGRLVDYGFTQAGNTVQISSGSTLLASVAVQGDTDGTAMIFKEGSTQIKLVGVTLFLGNQALNSSASSFTAASLGSSFDGSSHVGAGIFSTNATANLIYPRIDGLFTVADRAIVYGNTGQETLQIVGTPDVTIDQNIERVELDSTLVSYGFQQHGNTVAIRKAGALVGTIAVQSDADGTMITFIDGTVHFKLTGTTMFIGSQALSQESLSTFTAEQFGSNFNPGDVANVPPIAAALTLTDTTTTPTLVGISAADMGG